ncbi:MAG: type II toxin-antitoxin system antitoxin SocA domain-containing protein [Parachlamydiales bacterium]
MEKSLGNRIKVLREEMDLSQEELAKLLNVDRASLSQIENGKRSVKAEELSLISKALNVSADTLLDLTSSPEIFLEKSRKKHAIRPIRINIPQQKTQKFKEVLLYILSKVGAKPNVGETVIYKLLYFIDFNFYEKYEEQLIGATYIKNHHGPTPIEFKAIIKEMVSAKELECVQSKYFNFPQKKYLPHRTSDLSLFTAEELQLINDVLNTLSNMTATAISEYSHGDVPWITTPNGEKIDYESVFYRTPPYSVRDYGAELS